MEILKCLEANDIESAAIQSLQGAGKAVLGGKFRGDTGLPQKTAQEKPQVSSLTCHLNKLRKSEQNPDSAEGRK